MWAQENKLLRDRTPSAKPLWFSLLIRSARHIHHMWTSSRQGKKIHSSDGKKLLDKKKTCWPTRQRCDSPLSPCGFGRKCLERFKVAIKFQGRRRSRKEAHCRLLITHNHRIQVFLLKRAKELVCVCVRSWICLLVKSREGKLQGDAPRYCASKTGCVLLTAFLANLGYICTLTGSCVGLWPPARVGSVYQLHLMALAALACLPLTSSVSVCLCCLRHLHVPAAMQASLGRMSSAKRQAPSFLSINDLSADWARFDRRGDESVRWWKLPVCVWRDETFISTNRQGLLAMMFHHKRPFHCSHLNWCILNGNAAWLFFLFFIFFTVFLPPLCCVSLFWQKSESCRGSQSDMQTVAKARHGTAIYSPSPHPPPQREEKQLLGTQSWCQHVHLLSKSTSVNSS